MQKALFRRLALILGDSLYPDHSSLVPDSETVFYMAEDYGLCTHYRYHKHKLVLFLSAMRSHAETIRRSWPLHYERLTNERTISFEDKLASFLKEYENINQIITYHIEDHFFRKRLIGFCEERGLKLITAASPGFLTTTEEFRDYLRSVRKPFMHTFYQRQRRRLNILLDETGKPLGGKWSFDEDNRKKLPKGITIPRVPEVEKTKDTEDVIELVDRWFTTHPGHTANFFWATTREDALKLLSNFFKVRFQHFGPYEDAIDSQEAFLFHSTMSPYLNLGLITPQEVVDAAMEHAVSYEIHYPSLEGFIRQIIGWREFIRGIYHEYDEELNVNHLGHSRKMKPCWYEGSTGIPPLDDSINKAERYAYTHHIERLMVLGNMMLLCELDPSEVYTWFMEMYIDSADWVMAPNVYGMSQYADGGIFATKPYIGGANYIIKMSNYAKKGEWLDTVNGLYWRFIQNNRELFLKNQRMSMMVRVMDKMDESKRQSLIALADQFIARVTYNAE